MRERTLKHEGKNVHIVDLDVHEVPDIANLPVQNNRNEQKRKELLAVYQGRPDGWEDPKFYFGDLEPQHISSVDKLHNEGWQEGAEKAEKLAEGLIDNVTKPLSIRRRVKWSDDGDEFDKERLIDGHLDSCWRTTTRQVAVATPVINIAVSWGANAGYSHEQLFWSGAAAIALVKILEEAGYQTSLTGICASNMHQESASSYLAQCVRVKQAGEYIRTDAVASILCLGATFRTYLFLGITASPFDAGQGLGRHTVLDSVLPAAIESGSVEAPQIVLHDCYKEQQAKQAVKDALAELHAANLATLPEELIA